MTIPLGNTTVVAKSDGGISFYPDPTKPGSYPVLSIEVLMLHISFDTKRKKHDQLSNSEAR